MLIHVSFSGCHCHCTLRTYRWPLTKFTSGCCEGGPPPAQSAAIQSSSTAGAGSSEAGKPGQQGDPAAAQRFFKTRLCNKFMNTGSCQYGDTCKYAHGHGDIRQPGSLAAAEGQGQFPGQFPGHMQVITCQLRVQSVRLRSCFREERSAAVPRQKITSASATNLAGCIGSTCPPFWGSPVGYLGEGLLCQEAFPLAGSAAAAESLQQILVLPVLFVWRQSLQTARPYD